MVILGKKDITTYIFIDKKKMSYKETYLNWNSKLMEKISTKICISVWWENV